MTYIPDHLNLATNNSKKDVHMQAPRFASQSQRSEKCLWLSFFLQSQETLRHLLLPTQNEPGEIASRPRSGADLVPRLRKTKTIL